MSKLSFILFGLAWGCEPVETEEPLGSPVLPDADGDCGTAWPLHTAEWTYTTPYVQSTWGGEEDRLGQETWTLGEMSLDGVTVPTLSWEREFSDSGGVFRANWTAVWLMQCDRGSVFLLGLHEGTFSNSSDLVVSQFVTTAAFDAAIPILSDEDGWDFDVEIDLTVDEVDVSNGEGETDARTTLTGNVSDLGWEEITTEDATIEARHLVVAADGEPFSSYFPEELWFNDSGLVQYIKDGNVSSRD